MKVFKPLSLTTRKDDTKLPVGKDIFTSLLLYGKLYTLGQDIRFYNVDPISKTLYTVPEGKYFFLVSACLCMQQDSFTRDDEVFLCVGNENTSINTTCVLRLQLGNHGGAGIITNESVTLSPVMPIRLNPGETITLKNDNYHASAACAITGYEIDISLLQY